MRRVDIVISEAVRRACNVRIYELEHSDSDDRSLIPLSITNSRRINIGNAEVNFDLLWQFIDVNDDDALRDVPTMTSALWLLNSAFQNKLCNSVRAQAGEARKRQSESLVELVLEIVLTSAMESLSPGNSPEISLSPHSSATHYTFACSPA